MNAVTINEVVASFLSALYGSAVYLRNKAFDLGLFRTYRSSLPVVSVGNFTAGGTGKTPFVRYLAQHYLDLGRNPVILSRGYGGSCKGPYVLRGESDSPDFVGDEPLMQQKYFAGRVPVVISRKRVAGAKLIESQKLGDLILLDDGFQHRWLERDVNILLVAGDMMTGRSIAEGEKLLPLGHLRETVGSAMKRATALVSVRRGYGTSAGADYRNIRCLLSTDDRRPLPCGELFLHPGELKLLSTGDTVPFVAAANIFPDGVFAFSGIAYPENFFLMLGSSGARVVESQSFPDHHRYIGADVRRMLERKLPLVCTEKDAIKLSLLPGFDKSRIWYLLLKADFSADSNFSRTLAITGG